MNKYDIIVWCIWLFFNYNYEILARRIIQMFKINGADWVSGQRAKVCVSRVMWGDNCTNVKADYWKQTCKDQIDESLIANSEGFFFFSHGRHVWIFSTRLHKFWAVCDGLYTMLINQNQKEKRKQFQSVAKEVNFKRFVLIWPRCHM